MARKQKKETDTDLSPELKHDPKVRDTAIIQRLRLMVDKEALHPAWVCPLWIYWRLGNISNAEREAGDEYQRLVLQHRKVCQIDPEEDISPEMQDRARGYIERVQDTWDRCFSELVDRPFGPQIKRALDKMVVREENIQTGSAEYLNAIIGLKLLANFFHL